MTTLQILLLAVVLDYIFGDPPEIWRKYPHPAVLMGRAIQFLDQRLNQGGLLKAKGILVAALLVLLGFVIGFAIRKLPDFGVLELAVVFVLLAHNSLVKHVKNVATGLRESLEAGRMHVSYIVGRNTEHLDVSDVSRAAVESAAENFSDGVVAPIFWYLILGLPGLVIYKLVNTAASMIGHQTERYAEFGFGAARLDDVLNFVPARITGSLICLVYRSKDAFDIMVSDADLHRSINAGWPEAAMATVLGVSLSGPRSYDGKTMSQDSFLNPQGRREMVPEDIDGAITVLNKSWMVLAGIIALLVFLAWLL